MSRPLHVLVLEDQPDDAELVLRELRRAEFDPNWFRVDTEADYVARLDPGLDVILADYTLPQFNALRALRLLRDRGLDVPFIVVTGTIGEEAAAECIKQGATDYLLKDRLGRLGQAVARALEERRLRAQKQRADEALALRTQQFEAVQAVTEEITRELDLSVVLNLITQRAVGLLGVGSGAVFLWDTATQRLIPKAWHGLGDWLPEMHLRLGEGVVGTVAQRREGMVVNEYSRSAHSLSTVLARTSAAHALAEPLLYRDRLVGVIGIMSQDPGRPFVERDRQLLILFATQAAIAIENARLYEATRQAARQARSLYEVAHSLTTSLDFTEVLHLIAVKTTELLGTPHAQVVLLDEATQTLRLGAAHGTEAEEVRDQEFHLGQGVNGIVAQTRAPLIINDYQVFPHRVEGMTKLVADIGVPLLYRGRLLGVINSHATRTGSMFTQDHLDLLTNFADQAAIAIENARLYEELREAARQLEARVEERTRELREAMLRAEEASHAKSDFLANMSHELRTPLNSVIGFAGILLMQDVGQLNQKQERFLEHIHQGGKHLLELINDILDLSKVEAGKLTLYPKALSVEVTLEDCLVLARSLGDKKSQTVTADIQAALPPLRADPVRFKQILFNLLSNAVKFTPERGRITLTARRVDLSSAQLVDSAQPIDQLTTRPIDSGGEWLETRVTDTGIGIKAADLPRLFREFTQLEPAATKTHEGTGLGLVLTKQLVELHGGRVWAESEGEGRGSTFTVVLPFSGPGGQGTE